MSDNRKYKVGITVKEPWANNISYEVLDMTLFAVEDGGDGCSYVALKPNIGVTPGTDPTTWRKSTQAGQSIYNLAVKYHHFEGTEEEFEQQYQQVLQDARDATTAASTTNTQVQEAEALRVGAENEREAAENRRVSAEEGRTTAEGQREDYERNRRTSETARVEAENARTQAETSRENAETARNTAETARAEAEAQRQSDTSAAITDTNTARDQADTAATRANTAAGVTDEINAHPARISATTGNWEFWDSTEEAYVDSGKRAVAPIADNLQTNDSSQALSAKQGVVLDGKISQLGQKVANMEGSEISPDLQLEQGGIASATGLDVTSDTRIRTANYITADAISVTTSGNKVHVIGYKNDGTFVAAQGWITESQNVSISGADKYRLAFAYSNDANISPSDYNLLNIIIKAVYNGTLATKEMVNQLGQKTYRLAGKSITKQITTSSTKSMETGISVLQGRKYCIYCKNGGQTPSAGTSFILYYYNNGSYNILITKSIETFNNGFSHEFVSEYSTTLYVRTYEVNTVIDIELIDITEFKEKANFDSTVIGWISNESFSISGEGTPGAHYEVYNIVWPDSVIGQAILYTNSSKQIYQIRYFRANEPGYYYWNRITYSESGDFVSNTITKESIN